MSKIKDLYAKVNDIDDLKPTRTLSDVVFKRAQKMYDEDIFWNEIEIEPDSYGKDFRFKTYKELCKTLAEDALDKEIVENHLDINDSVYFRTIEVVRARIEGWLSEFEQDALRRVREDLQENWQDFLSYNEATLPKE